MDVVTEIIGQASEQSFSAGAEVSKLVFVKLTKILDEVLEDCSDIKGVMVSGADGRAWAQKLQSGMDENRFAAMSSALIALADNVVKEAHEGGIKNVLIESEQGNVFLMHSGGSLLLTVFTRAVSNLGMSLAHAKNAAIEIEKLMLNYKA